MEKVEFIERIESLFEQKDIAQHICSNLKPKAWRCFRLNPFYFDNPLYVSEKSHLSRIQKEKMQETKETLFHELNWLFKDTCPCDKEELNLDKKLKQTVIHDLMNQFVDYLNNEGYKLDAIEGMAYTYFISQENMVRLNQKPYSQAGLLYFQNPSSILAVYALNPLNSDEILDLAAAPGGKTHLLSVLMQNEGRIAANDVDKNRYFRLRQNMELLGVKNTNFYMHDGRDIGRKTPERFDRVLLDAPCSSDSFIILDDPKTLELWDKKKMKRASKVQKKLILSAFDTLKPNGTMIYSTCAFDREENEEVVMTLFHEREGVQIMDYEIPQNWQKYYSPLQGQTNPQWTQDENSAIEKTIRLLPNEYCNGFYFALIRKKDVV